MARAPLEGSVPGACRLLLVRHGQSTWNSDGRLQGHADPPLSSQGEAEARAAGERLSAGPACAAVYASDLERARHTAAIIAGQLQLPLPPAHLLPELRERHLGCLQGCTREEGKERYPDAWRVFTQCGQDQRLPGGGETASDVRRRAVAAIQRIAAEHLGGTVVVVSHGGTLVQLLLHCGGSPGPGRVPNSSISSLLVAHDPAAPSGWRWQLGQWADVGHLAGAASPLVQQCADFAPPQSPAR
eukprot:TRINITY_DN17284_c0_g1_i1.p1 TRINITY_DN17284_c0_g1~~TRINITY_DN17284_c0_g1_i1.p1  ORF type:complete len:243 (+),score=23.73 TRINITY_DN17284_c0_g1_i1:88-816(+)